MITYDPIKILTETGLIKESHYNWVIDIIDKNAKDSSSQIIEREIRNKGEQLSAQEKKALGLRTNTKIGRTFFESLTEKGRLDPVKACTIIVLRIMHQQSRFKEFENMRKQAKPVGKIMVEILSAGDNRDCKKSKYFLKRIPIEDVPDIPSPKCDADYCRCVLLYHFE